MSETKLLKPTFSSLNCLMIFVRKASRMSVEENLEKGHEYFKKSQYHQAIKEYEKAIESDPESSAVWYFLGKTYGRLGEYNKAIDCYQRAIEIDEFADAWLFMGWSYYKLDQLEKAIECFQQAVRINPKLAIAWYNLGLVYDTLHDNEKAVEYYNKAEELTSSADTN